MGGAVRDELLGIPVTDRDWVVVGSNQHEMLAAGYRSVGSDFPVFLHPDTHEEYALARLERKTGPGYHGFAFDTAPTVTLEEDLGRRDLTINAIARDENGHLIDPWNGQHDIKQRVLRHVSAAFVEDPVRVLRVARFMARLAHHGFTVAAETMELMRAMVANGEVNNLVAERVWQEMHAALASEAPTVFFKTLRQCGALAAVLPEIDALAGVPQVERWHPEIDTFVHTMLVVTQAAQLSGDLPVRFAALCHDLGKATTPAEILPSHHGHEKRGAIICDQLCGRLRIPGKFRDLATLTARYHTHCHRAMALNPSTLVKLMKSLDVKRKPERFEQFLTACLADARGRLGFENTDYPEAEFLRSAAYTFCAVDTASIAKATAEKSNIPDKIHAAQIDAMKQWLLTQQNGTEDLDTKQTPG